MPSQRFGAPPYLGLGASKIVLKQRPRKSPNPAAHRPPAHTAAADTATGTGNLIVRDMTTEEAEWTGATAAVSGLEGRGWGR